MNNNIQNDYLEKKNDHIEKILLETKAIENGHFLLSSGLHTRQYLQCAKIFMYPDKAQSLCQQLVNLITKEIQLDNIDLVVAPAIGGIIIGYEVARQLNKKNIFVERKNTQNNNQFQLCRGLELKSQNKVLIVEDVITTGKSVDEVYKIVTEKKAEVVALASLINRGTLKNLYGKKIISLYRKKIETFTKENIPEDLKNITAIKPGSRNIIE